GKTPTNINNNDIDSLNKIKKNNSNDLKKLDSKKSVPESKKQSLRRKTSSRIASSATVPYSQSSNRRNELSVIKNSDSESDSNSETNSDNEEEDDDDIPLGLRLKHSQYIC